MRILEFIKRYDPASFGLIYAIKATISGVLCVYTTYHFFGPYGAIFGVNASMSIFFLNALDGTIFTKIKFLTFYVLISLMFLPFSKFAYDLNWCLVFPTFIWMFFISASAIFSSNLNKILLIVNVTGLVSLIVQSSGYLDVKNSVHGLVVGGIIASTIRLVRVGTYGKFTKTTFKLLLDELAKMSQNLFRKKSFDALSIECESYIDSTKKIFAHQSSNIKDARVILNHSKAIFYLYKLEDIFQSLISLKRYFGKIKDVSLLTKVKNEITYNIYQLKNIFYNKKVDIRTESFEIAKKSNFPLFIASLSVIYAKFFLIRDGGEDKIALEQKEEKSFNEIIKSINLENETIINSFKLALSVSLAILIAQLTKVDHGVWIAIGVLSINRATSYMTRVVGFNNIKGAIFGILLGLILIYSTKSTIFFIPIIFIGTFFTFYFKNFPILYFATIFMATFTMVFSILKSDFLELIIFRLADIFIGFLVALTVTMLFFRHSSEIKLVSKLCLAINKLSKLAKSFLLSKTNSKFIISEKEVMSSINLYKATILENDRRKFSKFKNSLEIYKNLYEINSIIINLKDYIRSIEEEKFNLMHSHLKSDVNIIITQFEMIDKKIHKLPYYFYESFDDKLMCEDEKIKYLLGLIASRQVKILNLV